MYTPANTLTSMHSLKEWFDLQGTGYWSIYRGTDTRPSNVLHRNYSIEEPKQSWDLLHKTITNISKGGCYITILVSSSEKANNGARVQLDLPPESSRISESGQVSGLHGIHGNSPDYIEARINEALEKERLKYQIDQLTAQLEDRDRPNFVARIGERIAEHPALPALVEVFLGKILNSSKVALTGFPAGYEHTEQVPQPPVAENDNKSKDMQETQSKPLSNQSQSGANGTPEKSTAETGMKFQYDLDRLAISLETIRGTFPDIHEFIETLAVFVNENPQMAKQFFEAQSQRYGK